MHEGLHQTIARKRAMAAHGQARLDGGKLKPREEGELKVQVDAIDLELVELCAAANGGEIIRARMEENLAQLRAMKPASAELTLSIRAAETALWRFGIHLGNAECRSTNDECRADGKEERA